VCDIDIAIEGEIRRKASRIWTKGSTVSDIFQRVLNLLSSLNVLMYGTMATRWWEQVHIGECLDCFFTASLLFPALPVV
jgi:hypothetical protein